jgi:hypothetical protein
MIPIEVSTPQRTLRFSALRHAQLAPMVTATGISQAVMGSNDAGFAEGFRIITRIAFPGEAPLDYAMYYPGPQGFAAGINELLQRLNAGMQNPFERTFPDSISVKIEPLPQRPWAYLDHVFASVNRARAGETVSVDLIARDHQGGLLNATASYSVPAQWTGRALELIVMTGRELDQATGQPATLTNTDVRTFSAYLETLRANRQPDGLYIAVVERTAALIDQNVRTLEVPGSIERITRASDDTRYARQDVLVPLWETRVFPGRLLTASVRRPFSVID